MTNETNPPKKRGCFFYGCITLIVLMLIAAVGILIAFRFLQTKVREYADPQPMQLERGDASPAKLSAVQKRIDAFKDTVANQNTPQELALTADEINTLLAGQPDLQNLANRVFVVIEDDQLKANLSWPLDDVGLKGRYFNGTGTLKITVEKGDLDLRLQDVQTQSRKPLPPMVLDAIREHDFAEDLKRDAQTAAALRRLDNVQVKDGRIIIRSKPGG